MSTILDSFEDTRALALSFFNLEQRIQKKYTVPRMSSLNKTCLREIILGHKLGMRKYEYVDANGSVIFDIGNELHRVVQNHSRYLGDKIYGRWKCLACNTILNKQLMPKPPECTVCGANHNAIQYEEKFLYIKWLTAHPDAYVMSPTTKKHLIVGEIKTIDKDAFKDLVAPIADHVYQVNGYMLLSEIISKQEHWEIPFNSDEAYIYYFSKGHAGRQNYPVKIFTIKKQKAIVEDIIARVKLYRESYDPKTKTIKSLPDPVSACLGAKWSNYRAINCNVKPYCVAGGC